MRLNDNKVPSCDDRYFWSFSTKYSVSKFHYPNESWRETGKVRTMCMYVAVSQSESAILVTNQSDSGILVMRLVRLLIKRDILEFQHISHYIMYLKKVEFWRAAKLNLMCFHCRSLDSDIRQVIRGQTNVGLEGRQVILSIRGNASYQSWAHYFYHFTLSNARHLYSSMEECC